MNVMELGQDLVALCNAGNDSTVVDKYYATHIVSIEGQGSADNPARAEGIEAIRQKHKWWYDNHTVHSLKASGPYVGNAPDQFVVRFEMDITPTGEQRSQMDEVALYTVRDSKIVEEAFLYHMG